MGLQELVLRLALELFLLSKQLALAKNIDFEDLGDTTDGNCRATPFWYPVVLSLHQPLRRQMISYSHWGTQVPSHGGAAAAAAAAVGNDVTTMVIMVAMTLRSWCYPQTVSQTL